MEQQQQQQQQQQQFSNISMILHAAKFAAEKHKTQRRKGSDKQPYIIHPLTVADILGNCGVTDSDVICAALLHDTVEDTGTSLKEIETEFNFKIAQIVAEVSDDKSLPKDERKKLQVEHAKHCSTGAKLVKLADKIANVHDLLLKGASPFTPIITQGYILWAKAVVENLKGINQKMDQIASELWNQTFEDSQGIIHTALPIGDPVQNLQEYYKSMHGNT